MKRHPLRVLLLITAFTCLGALLGNIGIAQETGAGADFPSSKAWKKLDADTQQAWQDAMAASDPDRRFDCFVRVRAPADRGDESFLISKGFVVRIFSGSIATGYLAAKNLQRVAELSFVDSVRLSKTPDPDVKKVDRPAAKTP